MSCRCEEFTTDFRYCDVHHAYMNGTTRLTSVTRVIDAILPSDFSGIDPVTLENARDRGCQTDDLFCAYITGKLEVIPSGTRLDSIGLFQKLADWWDSEKRGVAVAQALVHDTSIAGKFDFWCDGVLYDLKCVYTLRNHYPIQVAAYRSLTELEVREMKLLHITERFRKPKLIDVPESALDDWRTVRMAWDLQRRMKVNAA